MRPLLTLLALLALASPAHARSVTDSAGRVVEAPGTVTMVVNGGAKTGHGVAQKQTTFFRA